MPRAKPLHVVVRWGESVLVAREVAPDTCALREAVGASCGDLATRLSVQNGRVMIDGNRELGVGESVGAYVVEATSSADDAREVAQKRRIDRLSVGGAFISVLAHGLVIVAVAGSRPAIEVPTAEAPQELKAQLEAIAAHAEVSMAAPPPNPTFGPPGPGGERGSMASRKEGLMGSRTAPKSHGEYGISGAKKPRSGEGASVGIDAQSFGMIGLLTTSTAFHDDASAGWGAHSGGADARSAHGNMWGSDIADAFGEGGLGLSGVGEGGGGHGHGVGLVDDTLDVFGHGAGEGGGGAGEGIGLGSIGTIGHGAGIIGGDGTCGPCYGRLSGTHRSKAPSVVVGAPMTSGRLPPEVIQRVVRQNFGRFRLCYENDLRAQPNLDGRVAVSFVIALDGSVASASVADTSLPASTATCVARAFGGLSFPAPEGGIVTVTYPINFSPD
jgi:hypothetical protein